MSKLEFDVGLYYKTFNLFTPFYFNVPKKVYKLIFGFIIQQKLNEIDLTFRQQTCPNNNNNNNKTQKDPQKFQNIKTAIYNEQQKQEPIAAQTPSSTVQNGTVQCSTVQYSTVQSKTVKYSAVSTVQ